MKPVYLGLLELSNQLMTLTGCRADQLLTAH
jgi:hypothetical protein